MSPLHQAATMALDALTADDHLGDYAAITALRSALAAPQAEPVAWYLPSPDGDDSIFRDHRTVVACTGSKWEGFLPLYAAPPAAPAVPLTDELIDSVIRDVAELDYSSPEGMPDVMLVTADELRGILQAHGIGGGNAT